MRENKWGLFSHINQALLRFWMYSTACMCFDIFICEIKSSIMCLFWRLWFNCLSFGIVKMLLVKNIFIYVKKCKVLWVLKDNWKQNFNFVFSFYLLLNRFNLSSGECSYLFREVRIGFELLRLSYTVQTMGCGGKSCRFAPLRLFSSSCVGENCFE